MSVRSKEVMFLRHRAAWIRLLISTGFSRDDAEDMVQRLWISIQMESGPRFPGAFYRYWTLALWRLVYARRRERQADASLTFEEGEVDEPVDPNAPDPARTVCVAEARRLVRQALAAIEANDPKRAEILTRYYYGEQKVDEIASEMEMGREAVKSQLFAGRNRLRKSLSALAPG